MGSRVGEYRLVRHWASGDLSQIFLARRADDALIALKTLSADRGHDRKLAERFFREGELAARADHENVVKALESFEHEGQRYLAMEFLEGETLHDVLRAIHPHRRMPAALALELVQKLARGLHHLHSLGAIHGDVCPANIILTFDGRVKLVDLGGRCEGSSAYAAPEQARGQAIDASADVFSLGLILFELLTGHRVRHGWGEREILASAISGTVPPLSDFVEVDEALDAIVSQAVEHDPVQRHASAEAFAGALLEYRESVVPGLAFTSKLADFMAQQRPSKRAHSERFVDPTASIEAALRMRTASPFSEPITLDVSWSGERTAPNELAPSMRGPWWPVGVGVGLIGIGLAVAALLSS
jgi:serine/threonine-protein kinase